MQFSGSERSSGIMLSLKEKLDLWVKITGVNPSETDKTYTIYLDGRMSDYDISKMNDKIQNALSYDETGVFAEAYLSIYLKQFLDNKKISIIDSIENEELSAFISDVRTLYEAVKKSNAEEIVMERAKKAMDFYHLACDRLSALNILDIHGSARKCVDSSLSLLQFSFGQKGQEFKLSKDIYMFKDINSLILSVAKGTLNGVTLAYIQDDDMLTESYFGFVIKSGDNLYFLTDKPRYKHSAQRGVRRCPGRDMSRRIESNFFPYGSVGDLNVADLWGSGRYGISSSSGDLLAVEDDKDYRIIGTIDSLEQEEAFWFIMVASLIKEKFYDNTPPRLEMSYTSGMTRGVNLEKQDETTLALWNSLPSMQISEIKDISETDGLAYDHDYSGRIENVQYILDRYADMVDKEVLNVVKGTEKAKLLEDTCYTKDYMGNKSGDYLALDLDEAETEKDILYRQKWIARYNYAVATNKALADDYNDSQEHLYDTIEGYITPRLEDLVLMHLKGELIGKATKHENFATEYTENIEQISRAYEFNKWYDQSYSRTRYTFGHYGYNKNDYKCVFTKKAAGVVISINPRNADELALVCGITKDKLPVQLQHYDGKSRHYYGNSILSNIDPFYWVIKDKFNEMDFSVIITVSKMEYIALCKKAGVPPIKFWENEKPSCFEETYGDNRVCQGSQRRVYSNYSYDYVLCNKCKKCKWYKKNKIE